ncbi:PMP47A Peroxisomal membrane protein PMP47A [Candida maltosa Xu316]
MSNQEIAHAVSGAVGGALALGITYPLITLSTIAQTAAKKKEEAGESTQKELKPTVSLTTLQKICHAIHNNPAYLAAKEIIEEKGILGLYAGLESALYGITLTNFIYYYFYELTSNVFIKANGTKRKGLSTIQSIITGAIAGAFTCVGSNPLWVANTRMMTEKKKQGAQASTSAFRALLDIVQEDGVGALFAGVLPALVLVIKNVIIAKGGSKSFTAGKAFFIGAFGKFVATTLTYPYITLKSRMHIKKKALASEDKEESLSMIQEIRKIVREEGLDGLYAGLAVKVTQSIATAAFLFYFKEELFSGSVKLIQVLNALSFKKSLKSPVVKV